MPTAIWLRDPRILLRNDKLTQLWPLPGMSPEEKVNAITRLVIILMLIGYLLTLSKNIFLIGLVTLGIVYALYYFQTNVKNHSVEKFSNRLPGVYPDFTDPVNYEINKNNYVKPTVANPLMNVTLPEIYYDPHRKPAAPAFNADVEQQINNSVQTFVEKSFDDDKIGKKLFANLGDAMDFNRSMIPFNANANTQVPNDRESFQEYLYGDMISAKEGNPFALERNHTGAFNYTMY
jgi:hypothetical protein